MWPFKKKNKISEEQKFDNIRFKKMTWLNNDIQLCMERATNKLFLYNIKTNTYQQVINQTDFLNLNLYGGMQQ